MPPQNTGRVTLKMMCKLSELAAHQSIQTDEEAKQIAWEKQAALDRAHTELAQARKEIERLNGEKQAARDRLDIVQTELACACKEIQQET